MFYAVILACEIGFWVFVAAGLISRYPLRRPRLGAILLALTPAVDIALLIAAVLDIRNGGEAGPRHALAAIYLGVSVAFGPSLIAWADTQFSKRFTATPPPPSTPTRAVDRARRERSGWYRHLAAWTIAAAVLGVIHLAAGNRDETSGLFSVLGPWLVILGIDFLWSFSYTLFPTRARNDRSSSS